MPELIFGAQTLSKIIIKSTAINAKNAPLLKKNPIVKSDRENLTCSVQLRGNGDRSVPVHSANKSFAAVTSLQKYLND